MTHLLSGRASRRRGARPEPGRVTRHGLRAQRGRRIWLTHTFSAGAPLLRPRSRSTGCVDRNPVRHRQPCVRRRPYRSLCTGTTPRDRKDELCGLSLHAGPRGDPVALCPRATTLHPHLGITLWIAVARAVDGSSEVGGQPVSIAGTASCCLPSSTGHRVRPPPVPPRPPHPDTASDQRGRAPSTLPTGPVTAVGVLCSGIQERRSGVDGGRRPFLERVPQGRDDTCRPEALRWVSPLRVHPGTTAASGRRTHNAPPAAAGGSESSTQRERSS
jgi:hypothetical protein